MLPSACESCNFITKYSWPLLLVGAFVCKAPPTPGGPFALPAGVLNGFCPGRPRSFWHPWASLWTVLRIMRWSWVARQTAAVPTAMPIAVPAIIENCISMPSFRVPGLNTPGRSAAMRQNRAGKSVKTAGSPNSAFFYVEVYGKIAVFKKEQTRTNKGI